MTETISLPILVLKNSVLFPFALMPVSIARPQSVAAVEAAVRGEEKLVAVFTQRNSAVDDPQLNDLYPVGTKAVIRRMGRAEDTIQALIQGTERIHLDGLDVSSGYPRGNVHTLPMPIDTGTEVEALERELIDLATRDPGIVSPASRRSISPNWPRNSKIRSSWSTFWLPWSASRGKRRWPSCRPAPASTPCGLLHEELVHEKQVAEVRSKIARQATTEINKEQREYLLRQQLRAIQEELGERSPEQAEVVAAPQAAWTKSSFPKRSGARRSASCRDSNRRRPPPPISR